MEAEIQDLLNDQIKYEATASMQYMAMASWADNAGFSGVANFFYAQSEEENTHMSKLVKFVNERGGKAIIPELEKPVAEFESLNALFETFLNNEMFVTEQIHKIIYVCLEKKNYNVHNFMQWYVTEQLEEESVARDLLDKLNIIGDDKTGHYLFDRDISSITAAE